MCITTYKDSSHWAKLANGGNPSILVSYEKSHCTNIYWTFNPKTKKIILTRDVTFLYKSYSEYTKVEKPVVVTTSYCGSDEEEELEMVPVVINNNNVNIFNNLDSD